MYINQQNSLLISLRGKMISFMLHKYAVVNNV